MKKSSIEGKKGNKKLSVTNQINKKKQCLLRIAPINPKKLSKIKVRGKIVTAFMYLLLYIAKIKFSKYLKIAKTYQNKVQNYKFYGTG